MANNLNNKKGTEKAVAKKTRKEVASVSAIKSAYLDEKDRKAIEFLKKHPVPESFFR